MNSAQNILYGGGGGRGGGLAGGIFSCFLLLTVSPVLRPVQCPQTGFSADLMPDVSSRYALCGPGVVE